MLFITYVNVSPVNPELVKFISPINLFNSSIPLIRLVTLVNLLPAVNVIPEL